jgi:uncharacterized protein
MVQRLESRVSDQRVAPQGQLKLAATVALGAMLIACAAPAPARPPAVVQPTPILRFEGDVQLPNGSAFEYMATLVPDPAASGSYLGTIDIAKQAMVGRALQGVELDPGERVEFALSGEGRPHWMGAYDTDGALACEFRQAGVHLPCSMRELKDVPAARAVSRYREQTPLPPFPYESEQVHFVNPVAHALLAGTLTVPAGAGPHPALIVVGDLGMQDRDGSLAGHKPWLVLADRLARSGIALLRMDPRGRASGGEPAARESELAPVESDVESGLAFLRGRAELDSKHLGLIGHGYGGVVAARFGRHAGVELMLLLASPALPLRQVLARKGELDALAAGASPEAAARYREDLLAALTIIEAEPTAVRQRLLLEAFVERLSARGEPTAVPLPVDTLLSLAETPGFQEIAGRDPARLLHALDIPVLALMPERDREVDPKENAAALRVAFADHPNAHIEMLPRLNHRLQTADAGTPAEYETISETFAPAALDRITSWIRHASALSD